MLLMVTWDTLQALDSRDADVLDSSLDFKCTTTFSPTLSCWVPQVFVFCLMSLLSKYWRLRTFISRNQFQCAENHETVSKPRRQPSDEGAGRVASSSQDSEFTTRLGLRSSARRRLLVPSSQLHHCERHNRESLTCPV